MPVEATENADSNEEVMPVIEETAEATSENEASSDAEVVYVVVTATPSANIEDTNDEADSIETVAATSDTEESSDAEETESVVVVPDPNFDLDLSGVPETINYLAEYGVANLGEELFMENLVDDMSCQSCHTDLSYVSQQENAPSYIWAAIYSAELHGDLASQYERVLSGADTAHLIAYLMSFNDVQE